MIRPTALSKNAFDATNDEIFYFTSIGGEQVVKNKLIIRLNSTNEIVYENTVTSYASNQTLPKNTLTNGNYYNYTFVTYDVNDNASEESNIISFYCYTTPTIEFKNIFEGKTIENASYSFEATYNQIEGEYISFFKFYLYDARNNLIGESDNLYSTEDLPITFKYRYEGFENHESYKIKAIATTINGTIVTSDLIGFNVTYINPILFSTLDLENKCREGYNQIISNMIIAEGKSIPNPPDYVENDTKVNITNATDYVKWDEGFSVDKDFRLEIWYGIGLIGKEFKLVNKENSNTYFVGKWVREIPYGYTEVKDYVEVIGYVDNVEKFYMRSNYVDIVNNTADIILWFNFNPSKNKYELILDVSNQVPSVCEWNGTSNIQYNRLTTIQYRDEVYKNGVKKDNVYGDMSPIFPITNVELTNGVYDNIDITCNVVKEFSKDYPIWDYCTYLNCDFNGNINGGNVNILLSQLDSVKIKAREVGTFDWITLYDIPIRSEEDLFITKQDYRVPSDTMMEYALVPTLNGGIEGDYITNTVYTKWDSLFVTDIDGTTLALKSGVNYSNNISNSAFGTLQPIGLQYPIITQNGKIDYESGTITGNILQENFVDRFDRKRIIELTKQWSKLLKNGKSKIIKDWNGNIWIGRVNTSPTNMYNQATGNAFNQVTFSFVEQGKWDNQKDLEKNRFIEVE